MIGNTFFVDEMSIPESDNNGKEAVLESREKKG